MAKKSTVSVVSELAKPVADELGLTLWDVRFEKEGSDWFLRILIDKPDGVGLEDCEAMSRRLDKLLDETDPIEQSYCLEVSSPGLGRELSKDWHFTYAIGQPVRLRLIRPLDGMRELTGTLLSFADGQLRLDTPQGERAVARTDCARIQINDDDFFMDFDD